MIRSLEDVWRRICQGHGKAEVTRSKRKRRHSFLETLFTGRFPSLHFSSVSFRFPRFNLGIFRNLLNSTRFASVCRFVSTRSIKRIRACVRSRFFVMAASEVSLRRKQTNLYDQLGRNRQDRREITGKGLPMFHRLDSARFTVIAAATNRSFSPHRRNVHVFSTFRCPLAIVYDDLPQWYYYIGLVEPRIYPSSSYRGSSR